MCLAIYKPKNTLIPEDYLETAFYSNPHGAGFAYYNGSSVVVRKGYFTYNSFIKDFKRVSKKRAIIHFRWATSGKKDVNNCHPFVFDKYVVIHNGVLNHRNTDTESDTNCFTKDVLSKVAKKYGFSKGSKKFLSELIGPSNKMIIMANSGKIHFLNEEKGHWNKGVWYSNDSYEDNYKYWTKVDKENDLSFVDYYNDWVNSESDCDFCDFCSSVINKSIYSFNDSNLCDHCYNRFVTE